MSTTRSTAGQAATAPGPSRVAGLSRRDLQLIGACAAATLLAGAARRPDVRDEPGADDLAAAGALRRRVAHPLADGRPAHAGRRPRARPVDRDSRTAAPALRAVDPGVPGARNRRRARDGRRGRW